MRRSVSVGAFALVAAFSLHASADTGLPLYPKAGCQDFTDPAGDASFTGVDPSSNNFDITGVSYRMSADVLTTVIRVPGLKSQALRRGTGDTWISTFKSGSHTVALTVSRFSPVPLVSATWDSTNPLEYLNTMSIDGTETRAVVPGAEFDAVRGYVTISVDRPGLEGLLGAPLGDLTGLGVEADSRTVLPLLIVDQATAGAKQVVDATANTCFT